MSIIFSEVPSHLEIERRYLLSEPPPMTHPALAMARPIEMVQTYLGPIPGWRGHSRVRMSTSGGVTRYDWGAKTRISAMTKRESEAEINKPTYEWLLGHKNDRKPTLKVRRKLRHDGLVFDLDRVKSKSKSESEPWILEVELESEEQEFVLPSFLKVEREITFESFLQ